jgi:hypothetical protein
MNLELHADSIDFLDGPEVPTIGAVGLAFDLARLTGEDNPKADASVAMVYLMHVCAAATIAAARNGAAVAPTLKEIGAGRHLSTAAFSEAGSRSHFWAPVSRARRNAAGSPRSPPKNPG